MVFITHRSKRPSDIQKLHINKAKKKMERERESEVEVKLEGLFIWEEVGYFRGNFNLK